MVGGLGHPHLGPARRVLLEEGERGAGEAGEFPVRIGAEVVRHRALEHVGRQHRRVARIGLEFGKDRRDPGIDG